MLYKTVLRQVKYGEVGKEFVKIHQLHPLLQFSSFAVNTRFLAKLSNHSCLRVDTMALLANRRFC